MEMNNLEEYLSDGIKTLVLDALKQAAKNPKETAFLLQYAASSKKAEKLRHKAEKKGKHIPSFLIASITNRCNLNCSGCYHHARGDSKASSHAVSGMSRNEWGKIFKEAAEIGVSAILLSGGEPLMRIDVLEEAALHQSILFPVFTNGTMLDTAFLKLFEEHRNLVPIISIEGDEALTDTRRGQGTYKDAMQAMEKLKEQDLLFGTSITVTNKNLRYVTGEETISRLENSGGKVAIFVEYVPFADQDLVLDDKDRLFLEERVTELKKKEKMIVISFPGDEKVSGGCLAAGRGFFHINANGGAEPCPFSPYSDSNVKTTSLEKALESPLFTRLRNDNTLLADHKGGCVLFDMVDHVKSIVGTDSNT
ncbi:MAG: radical SAM protein [Treponema sp.]|jgi:MoaA/NifB/PqqE/SkfB family radical SAM enzyme|nr:radical SAM protein [Treponema sp.]